MTLIIEGNTLKITKSNFKEALIGLMEEQYV